jgi:hypothetical protein
MVRLNFPQYLNKTEMSDVGYRRHNIQCPGALHRSELLLSSLSAVPPQYVSVVSGRYISAVPINSSSKVCGGGGDHLGDS